MANTYAWVVEQESARVRKDSSKKGDHWVLEQQIIFSEALVPRPRRRSGERSRSEEARWEEAVYGYNKEAARRMRHEEELRHMAVQREKEKVRAVQEEVRRIESRIQQRRIQEKLKFAEERFRAYAELRERETREQERAERIVVDAWQAYEDRWTSMIGSSEVLTFRTIPWPVVSAPTCAADITPGGIVSFIFSPLHSKKQSRKERIRSAQLRWHPDRFRRVIGRVREEDKGVVEAGVGIVARCLNDLMARETSVSQNVCQVNNWLA